MVMTEQLPVLASQIAKASEKDKELATVITAVQHGYWPSNSNKSLTPYYSRRNDLTAVDGSLIWSRRVVIPTVFLKKIT